ncbi:TPA: hypothetical protein ACIUGV_004857, partial [Salmonella enterica subsp. enterica serovar Bahrenfeld]
MKTRILCYCIISGVFVLSPVAIAGDNDTGIKHTTPGDPFSPNGIYSCSDDNNPSSIPLPKISSYWIFNIETPEQLSHYLGKIKTGPDTIININAGYGYKIANTPDYTYYQPVSVDTLGDERSPLILNGDGYTEYTPPYNGFYSSAPYDFTAHTVYTLGIGNYDHVILNNAFVSTHYTPVPGRIAYTTSIKNAMLNNSFLYLNANAKYSEIVAKGKSTIAVVGTYLGEAYLNNPYYKNASQYVGREYINYTDGPYNSSIELNNSTYYDSSREILRGVQSYLRRVVKDNKIIKIPISISAESYNSVFRDASGQRVMQYAVAHSPSFYDNAWLKVENDGEVANAVLNQ